MKRLFTLLLVVCTGLLAYRVVSAQSTASAGSGNVPRGTIVAWFAKAGPIPGGWAICDGANGTPNLRGQFIRGASNIADNGKSGGADKHHHGGSASSDITKTGWSAGKNFESEGNHTYNHSHPVTTDAQSNLPPYTDIVYIMKVK